MGKKRAFTLIELLIVVAIIGILAAIAVPNFMNARVRAKVAQTKSNMKAIETALGMYRIDYTGYPYWPERVTMAETYRFLTTPIAYLNENPVDPFLYQKKDEPEILKVFEGSREIDYVPYDSKGILCMFLSSGSKGPAEWMLVSLGPDKCQFIEARDCGPNSEIPNTVWSYNPSNGVYSPGDLLHMSWLGMRY